MFDLLLYAIAAFIALWLLLAIAAVLCWPFLALGSLCRAAHKEADDALLARIDALLADPLPQAPEPAARRLPLP